MELGERLQSVRKRQGLTQRELARSSGVSLSLIKQLETGVRDTTRLETLRKLASALRVTTTVLMADRDSEEADAQTFERWEPVRRALVGEVEPIDEPASPQGVTSAMDALKPLLADNRYHEVAQVLPMLLRDAEMLSDRHARSRLLNIVG